MRSPAVHPVFLLLIAVLAACTSPGATEESAPDDPRDEGVEVTIVTDKGDIVVSVDTTNAPRTAANFLRYVDAGLYEGGSFYRTVRMDNQPDNPVLIEVVQAGADPDRSDEYFEPIRMESTDSTGLRHVDGTISMARGEPHTATHSFFITIGAQPELDFGGARNPDGFGFAAFGQVVQGMDVIRSIQSGAADGQRLVEPVRIEAVRRVRHDRTPLRAGFVVTPGVFNSELMAPYDIFHHTIFRDTDSFIEPFIVADGGGSITTFEGITVQAHYSYDTAPELDILVIPSTEGSMDRDLQDEAYLSFLRRAIERADWVVTLCDGAFPLAETGALAGRMATTFPGDRDLFAERFPDVVLRRDVRFVVDGKYITSVGGGMSYEPALWLVEHLYGKNNADLTAEGMVWDWNLEAVPHVVNTYE